MMDFRKFKGNAGLLGVVLLPVLLGLLVLGGCENDPVAPQDEPPALSPQDVAAQAGYAAMAAGIVGAQAVDFQGKSGAQQYPYVFAGDVTGQIILDFYAEEGGAPATWADGRYVELYTIEGSPLNVSVGFGGTILLGFDLSAVIAFDQNGDRTGATIDGTGTYDSGPYDSAFSFAGLVVNAGGVYPGAGTMTFTSDDVTATVTFNGSDTATLDLSNGESYTVNLENGELIS